MKDDNKLQSMLLKINKFMRREDVKNDCEFDFQAQRIFGFIRDSYQEMKNRNEGSDYYGYNSEYDEGIYIRNTNHPYFGVALQWGLCDLQNFQKFCNDIIHEPGLAKDDSVSNLEFFIDIKNENFVSGQKKMRCNYILADDLNFLYHAIEGCTHRFCKNLMKE